MEKSFKSRLETRIQPIIEQAELNCYRGENSSLKISTSNSELEVFDGKSLEPSSLNRSRASNSNQKSNLKLDKEEIYLLAKLIHAEARGESMKGKIAVGAVILNRLESSDFPKTISEVIFQKNNRVYQFSPVEDGSIKLEPNEAAWRAAEAAASGEDPTNGSLFFYNPEIATDDWIKTLPVATVIGNHVFAR
jgi:spore germination cell wall hydrolase CwlJ-like protein